MSLFQFVYLFVHLSYDCILPPLTLKKKQKNPVSLKITKSPSDRRILRLLPINNNFSQFNSTVVKLLFIARSSMITVIIVLIITFFNYICINWKQLQNKRKLTLDLKNIFQEVYRCRNPKIIIKKLYITFQTQYYFAIERFLRFKMSLIHIFCKIFDYIELM